MHCRVNHDRPFGALVGALVGAVRRAGAPAVALAAALLATGGAAAQEIRAWDHGPYGRLVFDWDAATEATIETTPGAVTIRTGRPVDAPTGPALDNLSAYLRAIRVAPDGRTVVLETAGPLTVDRVAVDYGVVVDLRRAAGTAAPATSPPVPPVPPAAPAGRAAGAEPGDADPAPVVPVRGGERSGFSRLVFDWPVPATLVPERDGERLVMRFDVPGRLDTAPLADAGLSRVSEVEGFDTDAGLAVAARVPVAARVRHFTSGLDIIVDVLDPAAGAPPAVAQAQPSGVEAPAEASAEPVAEPETPFAVPADGRFSALLPTGPDGALAVFLRTGRLWIVAAGAESAAAPDGGLDIAAIAAAGEAAFGPGETVVGTGGVAVVHVLPREAAGLVPVAAPTGDGWRVAFVDGPAGGAAAIDVSPQPDYPLGARLLAATGPDTGPVGLVDPAVGDRLHVVPVRTAGAGVPTRRRFAQLDLLPTVQGLVVAPRADAVAVRPVDAGVAINAPDGLAISDPAALPAVEAGAGSGRRVLDIPGWRAPDGTFNARRQELGLAAATAPEERRDAARLDLARLMVAHGLGAEALGLLDLVARSTPDIVGRAEFRVLRGAAAVLDDDGAAALSDFDAASFADGAEAALWRGAALADQRDWPASARAFNRAGELISAYPEPLRERFLLDGIEAAVRTGGQDAAEEGLDWLEAETAGASEARPRVADLRARLAEARGDTEAARSIWQRLADGPDRLYATRAALALDILERDAGTRTPADSVEALEALRFKWRGDALEATVLKRLGDAKWDAGRFADAFDTWETASGVAPGSRAAVAAATAIDERFAELFGTDRLDAVPVLDAWAVFDGRRDLVPEGAAGDRMIEAMAERLASVDLLDRAAGLLDGMVEERVDTPMERARLGARVAGLRLLDGDPARALDALDRTAAPTAGTSRPADPATAAASAPEPAAPPAPEPERAPEPPGDPLRAAFDRALADVLAEQEAAGAPIDLAGTPIVPPDPPAAPDPPADAGAGADATGTAERPGTGQGSITLAAADAAADAADAASGSSWIDRPGGEALVRERRLLRARALSETGEAAAALAVLGDDATPLVDRARVDIARGAGLWDRAAEALDRLIGPPPRLGDAVDTETARRVVDRAVALSLAEDAAALDALAIAFGPAMEETEFANTFAVLTRTAGALGPSDDLETIRRQVAEVGVFEDFLERYRSAAPAAIN